VDENLKPHEAFMGLHTTTSTTGEALSKLVIDSLLRLDLSIEQLRGQAYDGAANMAGKFNGTQALITRQYPLAMAHSSTVAVTAAIWWRKQLAARRQLCVMLCFSLKKFGVYCTNQERPKQNCSLSYHKLVVIM
jgi:hypothetical protein